MVQEFEVQVKPYELTPQGHIERDLCDYEQRIVDALEVGGASAPLVCPSRRRSFAALCKQRFREN
jgi:hypothetical protein